MESLEWNYHGAFKGVALKHLVMGDQTEGKLSCHLVRIEAGCEIGDHIHESNWELHEVVGGTGTCFLGDKKVEYEAGISAVIPEGKPHRVVAGDEDLYILAKFVPALV